MPNKIKVLMVCHGNICRSPMAEMVFKEMIRKRGIDGLFDVQSMATSSEEIGNDVHRGTKEVLARKGIPCERRRAKQINKADFDDSDYVVCMDTSNVRNLEWRVGEDVWGKVSLLMDYTKNPRDIADPWYTGNFDVTYEDIKEGCEGFLEYVLKENEIE